MIDTHSTVLITGATDGIGTALAQQYQARGARLILVGRRPRDTLDPALFTGETYCQVDLSRFDCAAVVHRFLHHHGIERLDLLIHNAGIGHYGPVEQQSPASIRELVSVNLRAPVALTHVLLPRLLHAHGTLVFISSVVAALPGPKYPVYAATKAALDGFARSLRIELRGQVAVQVIHPGATRTGMHAKSGAPLNHRRQRYPTAEATAARIVRAIEQGRRSTRIGLGNRVLWFAGRQLEAVVDWLAAHMARRG